MPQQELTPVADLLKNSGVGQSAPYQSTSLTDAASIVWDVAATPFAQLTLGGNRTLSNPVNMTNGGVYIIRVTQDATGSRALAYGSSFKWAGASVPTITATAGAIDILTFVSDGVNMYGTIQQAFA